MKTRRIVRKLDSGKLFIETDENTWIYQYTAWLANPSKYPAPMPKGHAMFKRPSEYNCEKVQ